MARALHAMRLRSDPVDLAGLVHREKEDHFMMTPTEILHQLECTLRGEIEWARALRTHCSSSMALRQLCDLAGARAELAESLLEMMQPYLEAPHVGRERE
jgi:hypothetical protein